MQRLGFWLIFLWLCCLVANPVVAQQSAKPAKPTQRYALLIGVNEYAPPLGKLEYCHNDIKELAAHFAVAGFTAENITLMQDQAANSALRPSKSNIDKQLELRLQLANEEDVVVMAFSGHGLLIDGKSYLCPSDSRLDTVESLISIDHVYAQLEKCRASQKVLIIDACRNEPIVRGFKSGKLADDLSIEVQAPPKGLIVLSSCEPKQFSAEDAKLKHGVFMYYIMQGLKGLADTDTQIGGNSNGRVSLDELYYYAHEKTKTHVANSHGISQKPVMRGEIVGRIDIAMVPDSLKLQELAKRETKPALPENNTEKTTEKTPTRNVTHPLLQQADAYYRQADHESAIRAYTAVVDNTSLDSEIRTEARKSRGAAYLARGSKEDDIDNALIDQLAAGLPGIRMTIRASTAELKVNAEVKGKLKQNQTVLITNIAGKWLWVESVDGSDKIQGYLAKAAVTTQPVAKAPAPVPQPLAAAPTPITQPQTGVRSPTMNSNNNFNNQSNNGFNNNSNNGRTNSNSNNRGNRPPSIWETPEWETPRQIRERRANGTLR